MLLATLPLLSHRDPQRDRSACTRRPAGGGELQLRLHPAFQRQLLAVLYSDSSVVPPPLPAHLQAQPR